MKVFKIVILMVVVAFSTSVTAQKDAKIGHINSNDLLSAMPERTAVQKDLEEYAGQLKVTLDAIEAVPTSSFPTPAKRPHNSRLDTRLLRNNFGLTLPAWQQGVAFMLEEIKK